MADEKKDKKDKKETKSSGSSFETMAEIILVIIVLASLAGSVVDWFGGSSIGRLFSGSFFLEKQAISGLFVGVPVSKGVSLLASGRLFDTPGGTVIGTKEVGSKGTIIAGPEYANGERYWLVGFSDGTRGWVAESSLQNENGGAFRPGRSPVGSMVTTFGDPEGEGTTVLGSDGRVIGSHEKGEKGTVTRGPEVRDGKRFWFVDFENGADGWVAEEELQNETGGKFDNGNLLPGHRVVSKNETAIYGTPGGADSKSQRKDVEGTIVRGPVYFNGERYWYVDFDSGPDGWVTEKDILLKNDVTIFTRITSFLKFIGTAIALVFLTGAVYAFIRLRDLNTAERPKYSVDKPKEIPKEDQVDPRWERIINHLNSENPNDWRLAILEADIILDGMLQSMGYHGDTIGERLKSVEESDFTAINLAWEAHKVRNLIAHQGSDYLITQREAKRVISLYRQVFEEFHLHTKGSE
ncbi:MAG: hypothetical protein A2836_03610 [Candidatus Taylorbacteria bacterium RIFCSPHIGHO2_01_FULL_45_63]|uniref:SH3b domain-containing protein n=1 Tax=Candidatus Taylorbacteria bacterium RIFCSPHIGHO2_02_FULL_45_35 TaxID=1802311 RepID=A0A1G2MTD6_9BACT|nr:MAG: hypothetical protein A2836_03610 [Candidatus Taylorbacteria bacterium RIFCSPHIGHO2_01_FULL_45_63]OHA26271.1 MAG: hypothetical protein A3D56_02335 [Candidatus Taylorbacteria bacterium RIFCSPHIGHO2_02_FULL_45_35]OHA32832.1 MAG: hypothetical protein A3A22_02770 [Candidatus Taylorbacteria bacterium RIFCSPLOWO2_01_FULL_45_34b]